MPGQLNLKEHLRQIEKAPWDEERLKAKIHAEWRDAISKSPEFMHKLYACLLDMMGDFDGRPTAKSGLLYKFLTLFSNDEYIPPASEAPAQALRDYHPKLKKHIERLLTMPDTRLLDTRCRYPVGTLGELVELLLELYFHHLSYRPDPLRSEIASLVWPVINAFPKGESSLVMGLLQYHTDPIPIYAEIIQLAIQQRQEGSWIHLASEMLGEYARREDFLCKHAPEIFTQVLRKSDEWRPEEASWFIEKFILDPLRLDLRSREEQLAANQRWIELLEKQNLPEELKNSRARQTLLEKDFEAAQRQQWMAAAKQLRVGKTKWRCVECAAKTFPNHEHLRRLVYEVRAAKTKPLKSVLAKKSTIRFKDFSFKLWVIEELMYQQKVMKPKFDVYAFARDYEKRELDIEADGYHIIPEVRTYFQALDIPQTLLVRVKKLRIDDGRGGGAEIYRQLWPFWDPGSGDTLLRVTDKALEDLALLPNLKQIQGLENCRPSKRLLAALEKQGLAIKPWDDEE